MEKMLCWIYFIDLNVSTSPGANDEGCVGCYLVVCSVHGHGSASSGTEVCFVWRLQNMPPVTGEELPLTLRYY